MSWSNNIDEYEMLTLIHRGTTSQVWEAKYKSGLVIVKIIYIDDDTYKNATREVNVMKLLDHKHIISLLHYFSDKSKLYIILPEMEMDLKKYILNKAGLDETIIKNIIKQILLGLEEIHKNKVIHRDIKANNIFIDLDGIIKIGDLGVNKSDDKGKTFIGTPLWMAPEMFSYREEKEYNQKVDIWCVGIVILEMIKTIPPYYENDSLQAMINIIKNPSPTIKSYSAVWG